MSTKTYRPHFSSTTDARVLRSREALRQAIIELLKSKELDQITIPQITNLAGIGRTTFFRHYPSKEALLQEIVAEEIRQMVYLSVPFHDIADTKEASLSLFRYLAKNKKLWKALITGGATYMIRDELMKMAHAVAAQTKLKVTWLPEEAGMVIVVTSTVELIAWWLNQKRPLSVEKIASVYERAILAPIYQPE